MAASIPNEMILASAGSGKTWQLTNRFIALMGRQLLAGREVTPERIVAVTFTRKAAGEFFDSILTKLARAASDADYARLLAGDERADPEAVFDPLRPVLRELSQADYRQLLRIFIARMPRLFLGTLDSFFAAVLRSFPAEFGLAGDFEILSDHLGAVERERVYRLVFQRTLHGLRARDAGAAAQRDFLEAFRRATFGREESGIRAVLDQFVENQHEILLHAAREELWGNPRMIWPRGCRWLGARVDLSAGFTRLLEVFGNDGIDDAQRGFWEQFRDEALPHTPGGALPPRMRYFLPRLLEAWPRIEAKQCEITVNRRKQQLGAEACEVLGGIVTHLVGAELAVRLERTQGVWRVLSLFEQRWSEQVRRRGRLTFQDMELILAGHEFAADMPRPMLAQTPGEEARLRIDYRLDARYDHWLLDEFQDTNYVQWSVIENLIDEAVQDTGDERTLFQVGDVKQAIYAWRGGDTRLFHDVLSRYNAGAEPRIKVRPLNVSWRSGHDVIDMVNRVFGDDSALTAMELPEDTRERWEWQDHKVAPRHDALPGHAVLMQPEAGSGGKVGEEDRFALVAGVLEEIQPVLRGLTCAILVQENRTGRAIVDFLRAHSPSRIPVMCESETAVATDNPVTLALLSIFQCAAHPGDTLAWEHLRMTPFRAVLDAAEMNAGRLASEVLRQVFDHGFEHALRRWLHALAQADVTLDAFSQQRAEAFALAARLFDDGGSRDIDEFLAYAGRYTVREPDTRSAVQVMTIHKSKGLTFDCVILPDLEGSSLTTVRRGIGVKRDKRRHVEWVFDLPPGDIVRADPVLATYREEREAEAAYEELCKFYVALTRAKHANYLIAAPRPASSTSKNFIQLLDLTLGGASARAATFGGVKANVVFETSTPSTSRRWFEAAAPQQQAPPVAAEPAPVRRATFTGRERPVRRTPSGSETAVVTARQLFSRGGRFARSYGTLVHAFFEQIEWLDEMDDAGLHRRWAAVPCADEALRQRALDEVRRCLAAPAVRRLLSRPAPDARCWREQRFEILLAGEWLSGTFDRVMIERDRATILDFKTDKPETDDAFAERIAGYRPQLETYREVLARMTGLPAGAISCRLLFTHRCEVVTL
ncbi:MAG: UvrD-helicase domain-containing protein [Verrucomicrobiaceae bacterium]|nr:UvrD-helicase domain-containing protein [Verrucomicrobiaceae bacterium]